MRVELDGALVKIGRRDGLVLLRIEERDITCSAERAYTLAMAILKERRGILTERKSGSPRS